MERKGPHHIPLDVLRRRLGNKLSPEEREARLQQISAVRTDVHGVLQQARERSDQLDEDSHASRIEERNKLSFLEGFNQKIARVKSGSIVDITKTVIDEGYDQEEAAEFQAAGLDYQTET